MVELQGMSRGVDWRGPGISDVTSIKIEVGTMGYTVEGYNPYTKVFRDQGYNIVRR